MTTQAPDATQRADTGQAGVGIATGQEQLYAQGLPKGAIMQRFGTAASVVRDLPGWFIADGTQPALVIDGVSYGSPNFNKMTIMGADGTAGFVAGNTGGAAAAGGHTHSFTQPDAHAITQPVVANHNSITLDHNHDALAGHAHQLPVRLDAGGNLLIFPSTDFGTGGSSTITAYIVPVPNSTAGIAYDLSQSVSGGTPTAHSAFQPSNHTLSTNVALSNNHSGGAVGAVTSPATAYPPYVAVYILIKVFDS